MSLVKRTEIAVRAGFNQGKRLSASLHAHVWGNLSECSSVAGAEEHHRLEEKKNPYRFNFIKFCETDTCDVCGITSLPVFASLSPSLPSSS